MTRLSYVFPCLAGALKITLLNAIQSIINNVDIFLLGLCFAGISFLLCLAHSIINFLVTKVCWHKESSCSFKLLTVKNVFVIITGFSSALEIYVLFYIVHTESSERWPTILATYGQGQLISAFFYDLVNYLRSKALQPSSQSLSGFVFLIFGSLLLQIVVTTDYYTNFTHYMTVMYAFLAGILSVISVLSCRQISITFFSYWSGTFVNSLEQFIFFAVASSVNSKKISNGIFRFSTIINTFLGSCGFVMASACSQYFGDRGGLLPAISPIVGGQIVAVEFWSGVHLQFGFKILSLLCIIVGSILTWNGRQENKSF